MSEEVIAIEGGHKLNGTVTISGAKNATVALIPSIVLSDEPVEIYNVPEISDVDALTVLLEELNCVVERDMSVGEIGVDPRNMKNIPLVSNAVDKWGIELRIYFNDTTGIPAYWDGRKYRNRHEEVRSNARR